MKYIFPHGSFYVGLKGNSKRLKGFTCSLSVEPWFSTVRKNMVGGSKSSGENTDSLLFEHAQSYGPLSVSNIIIQHHDGDQHLCKDQCGHKASELYLLLYNSSFFFFHCLS